MSVLIKGMEMPKCCAVCASGMYERNEHDELCFVCGFIKSQHPWECEHVEIDGIDTTKARADFCPLIEVPPHGRLIDADKIDYRNDAMHDGTGHLVVADNFMNGVMWINDCIDNAPTAIEAED